MDAEQTNVVGAREVVERLRRMIAEYRRHGGADGRRDQGSDGLIAAANPRVSSLRAFEPSYLPASASGIPTGLGSLDAELPWGGLPRGAVSQILGGEPGLGAMSLALAVAGRAARGDDVAGPGWIGRGGVEAESARPIVVIDPAGDFYPPAAVRFGLNPQRVLVVRPGRVLDAVWAAEQSLRCPAVAAVVARLERLGRVHSRRLQLAAEAGGGVAGRPGANVCGGGRGVEWRAAKRRSRKAREGRHSRLDPRPPPPARTGDGIEGSRGDSGGAVRGGVG